MDTDVLIVGAAPTGLTLAAELRLADVRVTVLERLPAPRQVPKAGGLGGRILDVLHYRGLLEMFEAAGGVPRPAPRFPFGSVHVDLTDLADPPMQAVLLPQPEIERLLEDLAIARGAEIRRGHRLAGLNQDDAAVTVDVDGPDGRYQLSSRFVVGCDGVRSRVRELAGIPFPGITYPEVNRLGRFVMPDEVTLRADGDFDVAGLGVLRAGYTQTDRGIFAIASYDGGDLSVYTSEQESRRYEEDDEMTVAEFQESVRRVLGAVVPVGESSRLTRFTYHARHAGRYRDGRVLVAGDAAHQFPSGGVAVNAGMLDAVNLAWKLAAEVGGWAPAGLLDSYHDERHLAGERTLLHTQAQVALRRGLDSAADALRALVVELLGDEPAARRVGAMIAGSDLRYPMPGDELHPLAGSFAPDLELDTEQGPTGVATLLHRARPVLLDLAGRGELRRIAQDWDHRVDVVVAGTSDRPADAVLIRPDGYIAWAAGLDEEARSAGPALRRALWHWFGEPKIHHE